MRTNGSKLIGCKDGDYYFVDSVFKHDDNLTGVTGNVVRPVSTDEWHWAGDWDNVAERVQDWYDGDPDDDEFKDFVDDVIATEGRESTMFDDSFGSDASAAFDALGIEHECTDCSECGRIFSSIGRASGLNFDEVFDRKALIAIQAYEDGAVSYDYAVQVIFGE